MSKLLGSALAITIAMAGCGEEGTGGTRGGQGGEGGTAGDVVDDLPWACSEQGIRDAIQFGGGPHTFACDGPTVVTTAATIFVDNDVTLDGEGALIVDGNDRHGVFHVGLDVTATLRGMTITGGAADFAGGGVWNDGDLTIEDCRIVDNRSDDIGAAIYSTTFIRGDELTIRNSEISNNEGPGEAAIFAGGALTIEASTIVGNSSGGIYCDGTLSVRDSLVAFNSSFGAGGGIENAGDASIFRSVIEANDAVAGGGVFNSGELGVFHTTILNNTADEGAGIYGVDAQRWVEGGDLAVARLGLIDIGNSTFTDNNARVGGAVYSSSLRMTVRNSTFSANNVTEEGGAFYIGGTTLGASTTTLAHNTLVDNTALVGSAVAVSNENGGETPTVRLSGNILAGACSTAGSAVLVSQGYNIESPGDSCGLDLPSDTTDATSEELALGPLEDNGGDTTTHLPSRESIAVDAIPEALCGESLPTFPLFDQRNNVRPQGAACDIGSVDQ